MIDVINLEKSFGEKKVLNGINITINKGDIVVVIGPSGSGKSTFLRCLNCMEEATRSGILMISTFVMPLFVESSMISTSFCSEST